MEWGVWGHPVRRPPFIGDGNGSGNGSWSASHGRTSRKRSWSWNITIPDQAPFAARNQVGGGG